jgi:DNA-binding MarR family transcriptional regulator
MPMPEPTPRTRVGERATDVILATFRANGLFLEAGGLLAANEGMTAARWQVLGSVELAGRPLTVPQIARRMGLTRQSVHVTVDRLTADRLVELEPNGDHRRSQLVRVTELGNATYQALDHRQAEWINRLAEGLDDTDLETTARVLGELAVRLDAELGTAPKPRQKGRST